MKILHHLGSALFALSFTAATALPVQPARAVSDDYSLVQGAEAALQAYAKASVAYAEHRMMSSVALWTLLLAAAVVLLEWLLSRGRPH